MSKPSPLITLVRSLAVLLAAMPLTGTANSWAAAQPETDTPIAVPAAIGLAGIACQTATSCEAVGTDAAGGAVVPIVDGRPGVPVTVPGTHALDGVTCESATSCVAVGSAAGGGGGAVVQITDGIAGAPITVPGSGALEGVACQSASTCEAVGITSGPGAAGVVVPITGGIPGTPVNVPGTDLLDGVACQSATGCEAVGSADSGIGVVVPITGGAPGAPISVLNTLVLEGVACQSASSCEAVGSGAFLTGQRGTSGVVVPITNGAPGPAATVADTGQLIGVACSSPSSCAAVGTNSLGDEGAIVPIAGGAPGTRILAPGTSLLGRLACEPTSCIAVGQNAGTPPNAAVVLSIPTSASATLVRRPSSHGAQVIDKLICHLSTVQDCAISERLTVVELLRRGKVIAVVARAGRKTRHRTVTVAFRALTIPTAGSATVRMTLNATGKRLLKQFGKLPVTLTISLGHTGARHTIAQRKLVLKPSTARRRDQRRG
jgi:hypothetical protein